MSKMQIVYASCCKLVFIIFPVLLSANVVSKAIELERIWGHFGVDDDGVNRHHKMHSLWEVCSIGKRQRLTDRTFEVH